MRSPRPRRHYSMLGWCFGALALDYAEREWLFPSRAKPRTRRAKTDGPWRARRPAVLARSDARGWERDGARRSSPPLYRRRALPVHRQRSQRTRVTLEGRLTSELSRAATHRQLEGLPRGRPFAVSNTSECRSATGVSSTFSTAATSAKVKTLRGTAKAVTSKP